MPNGLLKEFVIFSEQIKIMEKQVHGKDRNMEISFVLFNFRDPKKHEAWVG